MYGKEEAVLMGEVWNLQKKKLDEINSSDEWWQTTLAEFNAIADKAPNEDVKTCIGYHAIAAVRDIDAKANRTQINERLNYIGQMSLEQFGEFLKDANKGDMIKVNGRVVEVR